MHLPHLLPFSKRPLFFITTCTARRRPLLANASARQIIEAVWTKSALLDGWYPGRYVLMPDHVHFFARPAIEAKPLADWMKTWKSVASRQLAREALIDPPIWQPDYFDHFVRSVSAYEEKWEYVRQNPVRKGLCS
ncbi:MAG TPA: transposase, partial [Lacunisphaera sp.]